MRAKLVIFDCDGVLVDSEPLAARVLAEALLELGLHTTVDEVDRRYRGRSISDIVKDIEGRLSGPLPPNFVPDLSARTQRAFESGLTPIEGVAGALSFIAAQGVDLCVASSGSPEKIRHSLALTGLSGFFEDRLFSATQVARGKPAPDIFEFTAKQMGHAISDCVVIEDSIPGVTGAVAAGAAVYGFVSPELSDPNTQRLLLEERGAHVFFSMNDLPGLLGHSRV
jgi:HAD superfamily hydrolase (TIGR01509 family)